MIDITKAETVQIQIRGDGQVVWVNVDGVCQLRVCQCKHVQVDDERYEKETRLDD